MDLGYTQTLQTGINGSVKYRRRLDRTPEKNFVILQEVDKTRLNTLRSTLEEAKSRIARLRDENDEKDYIIEEERKLRQAAEENLHKHFVDLYNNPDVISELQHRLPRARKMYTVSHDPAIIMDDHLQPSNFIGGISVLKEDMTTRYGYRTDDGRAASNINKENRDRVVLDDVPHPLLAAARDKHNESLYQVQENMTQHSKSTQLDPSLEANHFSGGDIGPLGSCALDPTQAWSSLMSISHLLPPYISPNIYTSPLSPGSWSSQDSSVYQGLPHVAVQTVSAHRNHGIMDQRGKEQIVRSQLKTSKEISTTATQTIPQDIYFHSVNVQPNHGFINERGLEDLSRSQVKTSKQISTTATQTIPQDIYFPSVNVQPSHGFINERGLEDLLRSQVKTSKQISSTAAAQTTTQDIPTRGNSILPEPVAAHNNFAMHEPALQFSSHSTSLPSLHHLGNPGPAQPTCLPPRLTPYSGHRYFPAELETDNISQTSRLLVEIATLKKENEQLKEKLTGAKHEIESLNSNTQDAEGVGLDRIGSLIEEIRAAEKKRDVALKVLVGDVDEDRPTEVEQHDHPKKKFVSRSVQVGGFSDSELSEAEHLYGRLPSVSEVTDSGGEHQTSEQRKQKYVELLIARQREIMKVEMQKVLDERNEARQRVAKLEKKLTSLELSYYTDNRAKALLAKLRVTEAERDMAVAQLKYLTQDVNETKLMYRLHKALLSDSPVNQASVYQEAKSSNLDNDPSEKKPMNSVLFKEAEEKAQLETKIVLMEKEKQSQSKQIEKLHQLVELQRQKINALCAGPMLMEAN